LFIKTIFTYTLEKFLEEMLYLADAFLCEIDYSINREIMNDGGCPGGENG